MAKINIGKTFGSARSMTTVEIGSASSLDISIGDAHDMSAREVFIIERESGELSRHLQSLRDLSRGLVGAEGNALAVAALQAKAVEFARESTKIVSEKKWYNISASGLIEAAKAVGEVASPISNVALKILELLQKARV